MMETMLKYLGVKVVEAAPMTRGEYNSYRGWTLPVNENPEDPGFLVVYPDGYKSWCPRKQFEEANRPLDAMPFGHAIEALKQGLRVARKGWNGKGMYLWLLPAAKVKAEWCREPHLKAMAEANGGEIDCLPSIRMMTADRKVLTGWLASQTDILAEDWVVVS
jgi:hypothetical protein